MANKFTTKEILNKVLLNSSGNAVTANSVTTQEALNAALDTTNNRLNMSLAGGSISGDVTISGDLTVEGSATNTYDEIIQGTLRLDAPGSVATTLEFVPTTSQASQIKFFQDDGTTQDARIFAPEGATKLAFEAGTTEMMRMSSTGIGIGTDSPQKKVDIVQIYDTGGSSNEDLQLLIRGGNADLDPTGDSIGLGFGYGSANNYVKSGIVHEFTSANGSGTLHFCTSSVSGADTINKGDARMSITSAGNVGIGIASGDTNLHIFKASAGTVDAHSDAQLAVENSGVAAINILSGTSSHGQILFGDADDADKGVLSYDQGTDRMFIRVNGSTDKSFIVDANSRISLSNNDSGGTGGSDGTSGNTLFGAYAGLAIADGGVDNNFFGHAAGNKLTTGDFNTGLGTFAGFYNVTGSRNTHVGYGAGMGGLADQSNSDNTSVGFSALKLIRDGIDNVAIGAYAGINMTTGSSNVFIGKSSGNAYNSSQVTAVGALSAGSITSGNGDGTTAFGYYALKSQTSGQQNTAVGSFNSDDITTGSYNTAIGRSTLASLTTGSNNIAIGRATFNTSADDESYNIAIGNGALGSAKQDGTVSATNREVKHNIAIGNDALTGGTLAGTDHLEYNIAIGSNALNSTGANAQSGTIAIGYNSLTALTSGGSNTSVGFGSMDALTTGSSNTGLGDRSLSGTDDGANNVAVGAFSLESGNCGDGNTAVGASSLQQCTASGTVAVGYKALRVLTSGAESVVIGYQAGLALTTGDGNTVIGYDAFKSADGAEGSNVVIGKTAGQSINHDSSAQNVIIGVGAMSGGTAQQDKNVAVGYFALGSIGNNAHTGSTAVGSNSLGNVTTGNGNSALGYNSGDVITTGTNNVIIGSGADPSANSGTNQIVLGQGVTGTGNNEIALGNTSISAIKAQVTSITAYSSDERTKKDIADYDLKGVDFIKELQLKTYLYKNPADFPDEIRDSKWDEDGVKRLEDPTETQVGLIAQEVEEALAKHGIGNAETYAPTQESGIKTLTYGNLIFPLIKAVQELSARVEELENK